MNVSASNILKSNNISSLLITNIFNIRYLTGIDLSAGAVIIKPRSITLYTDGRYLEMASKKSFEYVKVKNIQTLHDDLIKIPECGFESEHVSVSKFFSWKKKYRNTKFIKTSGIIEDLRRSKSDSELKLFKKAQSITIKMLDEIPNLLDLGVTEIQVALGIYNLAVDFGADGLSFDPIVAFGKNSSSPHHHPTSTKLKNNQIIQIDIGAKYKGYCADKSRVFFFGRATSEMTNVLNAVKDAKNIATQMVKKDVTNHDLDNAAREALEKYHLNKYFVHSLGHGVGLEIHEGVILSNKAPVQKLLAGEVVTIEPGVYIPGKFGIRLEDEVIVN